MHGQKNIRFSLFCCQTFYDIRWNLKITQEHVVLEICTIKNKRNKRKLLTCDGVHSHEIQTKYFEKNKHFASTFKTFVGMSQGLETEIK